jgi:hypothetical protein
VFSVSAMQEINRAHCSDGTATVIVNNKTKDIIRIPFDQLSAPYIDSEDSERIWYIRRTYKKITLDDPQGKDVDEFIPANTIAEELKTVTSVKLSDGKVIPVNLDYTAVVWKVNGQIGWPLGIPDLLPSLQWAEKYTGYLKNQDRFAEALASLAWEYRAQTGDQAKKMAAMVAEAQASVAGTSIASAGMELKPLPGNSAVSFENGEPMAAQAAAAAELPADAVLGRSLTNAGGKIDPDLARMIGARRASATEFFTALLSVLGSEDVTIIWPDVESETPFREAQMMVAAWGTGMFAPDELRPAIASKLNIELPDGSTAPEDVLIPNTAGALQAAQDVLPDPVATGTNNGQGNDALGVGKLSDGDNTARDRGETAA